MNREKLKQMRASPAIRLTDLIDAILEEPAAAPATEKQEPFARADGEWIQLNADGFRLFTPHGAEYAARHINAAHARAVAEAVEQEREAIVSQLGRTARIHSPTWPTAYDKGAKEALQLAIEFIQKRSEQP